MWLVLALIRALTGFILTRSVGWAFPALCSHWALYESTSGLGPLLLAYLSLEPDLPQYALPALSAIFCGLERTPWTYGTAVLMILALRALSSVLRQCTNGYLPLPVREEKTSTLPPLKSLLICFAPLTTFLVTWSPRLPYPTGTTMDIMILTYPRPVDTSISVQLLSKTLDSFLPHTSHSMSISVFTHSHSHPAFQQLASDPQYRAVTFYADKDEHPADTQGQSLHLAEAFRWWSENKAAEREWVMLNEDDFPVCEGGWEVIGTVMNVLELDRAKGNIRSGFIGTGGR